MRGLEKKARGALIGLLGCMATLSGCSSWERLWERHIDPPANQRDTARPSNSVEDARKTQPRGSEIDTTGFSREKLFAHFNKLRGDGYQLDEIPRHLETSESKVPCLASEQEIYRGTHVKFVPITVHPAFIPRLKKLELLFVEEAEAFYGRAPRTVLHEGGYACRTSRFQSTRISEHAFGNAVDITGFSFGPLPAGQQEETTAAVPRGAFQVRISTHWTSRGGALADLHQSFLRSLGDRIVDTKVVRVVLGPSHRGHQSHFHLDMSPWRYVDL